MILAFDGNVFTGKSTLIKALAPLLNASTVNEQGYFLELENGTSHHTVGVKENAIFLQLRYLDAEEKRLAHFDAEAMNLLDRSFVSMAAHVFALNYVNGIDIRNWFLRELEERISSCKVAIPTLFCFITCSHETIRARILKDNSRNTDTVYYSEKYLEAIDTFDRFWVGKTEGLTIDIESVVLLKLIENIKQRIALIDQREFSTKHICSLLRELLA